MHLLILSLLAVLSSGYNTNLKALQDFDRVLDESVVPIFHLDIVRHMRELYHLDPISTIDDFPILQFDTTQKNFRYENYLLLDVAMGSKLVLYTTMKDQVPYDAVTIQFYSPNGCHFSLCLQRKGYLPNCSDRVGYPSIFREGDFYHVEIRRHDLEKLFPFRGTELSLEVRCNDLKLSSVTRTIEHYEPLSRAVEQALQEGKKPQLDVASLELVTP